MRRHILPALLMGGAILALAQAAPASAQSDILLRLRSGSPLGDRVVVDSASGFLAKGILGIGVIPYTGSGERMMWHPYKAAFRAGSIGSGGTQWDDSNVGFYTWAGGYNTTATGLASFAMGYQGSATGSYSVSMGYLGNATGTGSIAMGYRSTADASYAIAMGQRASANGYTGAIVFSDASTTDSTEASANNQFTVRAAGGMRLFTNSTRTTGVQLSAGGSSWSVVSDRALKGDFLPVDGEEILLRLRAVPVSTWRYDAEEDRSTLHIGPMAQDWHRAFGFTTDDSRINMSDFDGVNLAGIQALDARTEQNRTVIEELRAENARLRAQNQALEERLSRIESVIERGQ